MEEAEFEAERDGEDVLAEMVRAVPPSVRAGAFALLDAVPAQPVLRLDPVAPIPKVQDVPEQQQEGRPSLRVATACRRSCSVTSITASAIVRRCCLPLASHPILCGRGYGAPPNALPVHDGDRLG